MQGFAWKLHSEFSVDLKEIRITLGTTAHVPKYHHQYKIYWQPARCSMFEGNAMECYKVVQSDNI